MFVQVLIPCFNEAPCIAELVRRIQGVLPSAAILVCDNASPDDTAAQASAAGAQVVYEGARGKGNAVRKLFAESSGDICVLMDGDLTYDVASLPRLIAQFEQEKLDFLNVARRAVDKHCYSFMRRVGNRFFYVLLNKALGVHIQDVLSGYKLFSKRFIKNYNVESCGFEIEAELVMASFTLPLKRAETTAPYYARPKGNPSKLRAWKDGWAILKQILKIYLHARTKNESN